MFARVNGAPLRPDWVLNHFHNLTERAGLPRVRLHDLRHTTSGITADLYGHLTAEAALAAADSLGNVLDAAAAELANERAARDATTLRP